MVKHSLGLCILLLVGYSQIFAPLYRSNASDSIKKINGSERSQVIDVKAADAQTIFIAEEEEEEDRISLKKNLEEFFDFSYFRAPEYFIQYIEILTQSHGNISCITFFRSPYLLFQVFRL